MTENIINKGALINIIKNQIASKQDEQDRHERQHKHNYWG